MAIDSNFSNQVEKAQELMLRGNYREAREIFVALSEKDPKNTTPWYYLGLCHLNLDEYEEAIRILSVCLSIDSRHADALIETGEAYLCIDEMDAARHCFEKVLQFDGQNGRASLGLARLFDQLNDFEKAVEWYEIALRDSDPWDAPRFELSGAYTKVGRFIEADVLLETLMSEGLRRGNQVFIGEHANSTKNEIAETITEIRIEREKIEKEFESQFSISFDLMRIMFKTLSSLKNIAVSNLMEVYREIQVIKNLQILSNSNQSNIFLNATKMEYSHVEIEILVSAIILELGLDNMVSPTMFFLWDSCQRAM